MRPVDLQEAIKQYLANEDEYNQVADFFADLWRIHVGEDPYEYMVRRFVRVAGERSVDVVVRAIRATGESGLRECRAAMYFNGVLRRLED